MAVVTITITDLEDGGANVVCISDPPVDENDEKATLAQLSGAMMMKFMDALTQQAEAEGKSE